MKYFKDLILKNLLLKKPEKNPTIKSIKMLF